LSDSFQKYSGEVFLKYGSREYAALYKEVFGEDALLESRTVFDADKVASLISNLVLVEPPLEKNPYLIDRTFTSLTELALAKHTALYKRRR
jgi:hypothetical protein